MAKLHILEVLRVEGLVRIRVEVLEQEQAPVLEQPRVIGQWAEI